MTPLTDAARVLGRIERGEILAGPDAARTIAAHAETAYGAAFTAPAAQLLLDGIAWADALTTLNTSTGNPS